MIIVGTAGHIDHGKSSLVRRLTGTDPDRLPEEKARGMTIDLGFAFLTLPSGIDLGFVDVPGHERFVKTMVAGAGGVDIAILVVAADDGWMPQTEEHFQIVRLLGIARGLIALNKCDLVSPEKEQLRIREVQARLQNSPLQNAAIIPISTQTGQGLDLLTQQLENLAVSVERSSQAGFARLSADRAFIQTGIGTVATGTLRDGPLSVGDTVTVWPSLASGKIRTLQSRGKDVTRAEAGFRTAISLSSEGRDSLGRGVVVTSRPHLDELMSCPVLAVAVEILEHSPVTVEERRRLLLLSGTSESAGEAHLIFDDQLHPGSRGILLIKPEEPLFALVGDRVIVRLESPMVTIGGGTILTHFREMPRRRDRDSHDYLRQHQSGSLHDSILLSVQQSILVDQTKLLQFARWAKSDIQAACEELIAQGTISRNEGVVYHEESFASLINQTCHEMNELRAKEPHREGFDVSQLSSLAQLGDETRELIVRIGVSLGKFRLVGKFLVPFEQTDELKGVVKQQYDMLIGELTAASFEPLSLVDLGKRGKIMQHVIKISLDRGISTKIGSQFLILTSYWAELREFLSSHFESHQSLAINDLKMRFGISRKYAVPMLEETDRLNLTIRQGDMRIAGEKLRGVAKS